MTINFTVLSFLSNTQDVRTHTIWHANMQACLYHFVITMFFAVLWVCFIVEKCFFLIHHHIERGPKQFTPVFMQNIRELHHAVFSCNICISALPEDPGVSYTHKWSTISQKSDIASFVVKSGPIICLSAWVYFKKVNKTVSINSLCCVDSRHTDYRSNLQKSCSDEFTGTDWVCINWCNQNIANSWRDWFYLCFYRSLRWWMPRHVRTASKR